MKLSLSSPAISPYLTADASPYEVFRVFRETGFSCIDFCMGLSLVGENMDREAEKWKDVFAQCGIATTQAHAPVINPFRPLKTGESSFGAFTRALQFCEKAGFPRAVVHPGAHDGNTREAFFEANVAFFRSLIPYAEETGVGIMIENIGHYMDPYFLWSGADLRALIDAVDHPLVTACWDIGHANHFEYMHAGGSQYDSIVALGDKLTAIHAHDNVGFFPDPNKKKRVDMHMMPYSSAMTSVNWDAVLQGLKDIGYKGTFNFETVAPIWGKNRPDFVYGGEVVHTLERLPIEVWKMFNTALYGAGRFMLESYGLYEE